MELKKMILQTSINHRLMLVFLLIATTAKSQYNLVPNYSFETYTICPTISGISSPPPPWYQPTSSSYQDGSYFNACSNQCNGVPYNCFGATNASYQYARTGNAYAFIGGYSSQYILLDKIYLQTKLKDSLRKGHCYYAEFYTNLVNVSKYGCNNISMLFTNAAKYQDTLQDPRIVMYANPQILNYGNIPIVDTQNWVKVSGVFTAKGGEQYITIGNFNDNLHTQAKLVNNSSLTYDGAEYFLDDVSVIPLDSMPLKADAGRDTSIANVGDSVFIGSLTNGLTGIKWYDANGNEITSKAGVPSFYAKPIASTFYIIEQTVCGYYSRDTVNVSVGTVPLKFISYNLISSLRGTKQSIENLWQTANETNVSHFNILKSIDGVNFKTIGKSKAQNKLINEYSFIDETPNEGLNYYKIESVDFDGRKQYTETRILNLKPQTLNGISIYPNPAKDFVTIESKDIIKQIKVINQVGQIVYSNTINRTSFILNLTLFGKGLYIVQTAKTNGETSTLKLTINN